MPSLFFHRFRRITYSTAYLPEIDGLRFLAIFCVVLIMHISHYMDTKFFNHSLERSGGFWSDFIYEGGNGVPLFFVLSGFLLSMPFARSVFLQDKKVSLRNYFIRRLMRLEPPYIIALLLLFAGHVWIVKQYTFTALLPHLLASVFYLHGWIYHSFSPILPVAWSLEVEVQFYILAPLFCMIFRIRQHLIRRMMMLVIILVSAVYWFDIWTLGHVFMYLHYFFCGLLLADLYCSQVQLFKKEWWSWWVGMVALTGFLMMPSIHHLAGYLLKVVCMFLLVHVVLSNQGMKQFFSKTWMVLLGGMCYSIYLLHYAIVSATGQLLLRAGIHFNWINAPFLIIILAAMVVMGSAFFFILVEKPFMNPIGLHGPVGSGQAVPTAKSATTI